MADIDRINELIGEKDFKTAHQLVEDALKVDPNNVGLIKSAGLVAVNLEDWNSARGYFETVVKYQPEMQLHGSILPIVTIIWEI